MKIEILGTGCAKCDQLEANARAAADRLATPCELARVTDIREFARRGVMLTPALVVERKVLIAGRVAGAAGIEKLQRAAVEGTPRPRRE